MKVLWLRDQDDPLLYPPRKDLEPSLSLLLQRVGRAEGGFSYTFRSTLSVANPVRQEGVQHPEQLPTTDLLR
jgi:hypothetical protein